MTKREMLDRIKVAAGYMGKDDIFAFDAGGLNLTQMRSIVRDLAADVRAEEDAPRQAADAAPGPVRGFRDALVRVKSILGGLPITAANGTTREAMLRLCDDLNDAGNDQRPADVKPGPGQPGPVPAPPPAPRTVIIILPPGVRALIEAEAE